MPDVIMPTPESLLFDLWDFHLSTPDGAQLFNRFFERDRRTIEQNFDLVFNDEDQFAAANAIQDIIYDISAGKSHNPELRRNIPASWFFIFYNHFQNGFISIEAWTRAAYVIFFSGSDLNGPDNSRAAMLPGLRRIDPTFLMSAEELNLWLAMPASVTLYRGSCTDDFDATWQGMSWVINPDVAVCYAKARMYEHYDAGHVDGWPRLVSAQVPRSAIIAIKKNQGWDEFLGDFTDFSLLVDHESIPPEHVTELNPVAPDEIAAVKSDILAKITASRPARRAAGLSKGPR